MPNSVTGERGRLSSLREFCSSSDEPEGIGGGSNSGLLRKSCSFSSRFCSYLVLVPIQQTDRGMGERLECLLFVDRLECLLLLLECRLLADRFEIDGETEE